jgi:hypothetical protein
MERLPISDSEGWVYPSDTYMGSLAYLILIIYVFPILAGTANLTDGPFANSH